MLALVLAIASTACAVPETEIQRQLGRDYALFDADSGDHGWRRLNGRGCTDAALILLRRYASANARSLSPAQRSEILFHQAQALAFAGRNAEAIAPLKQALAIGGSEEWKAYVSGNLAFIRRDRRALRQARDQYSLIAPKSQRLRFLDGFLACPDKPYMTAAFCTP